MFITQNQWWETKISLWFSCVCSSKEDSLKDLQGLASQLFSKTKSTEETRNAETDNRRKQHAKELHPNSNLSPLARFLLSRFVEVALFPMNNFIIINSKLVAYRWNKKHYSLSHAHTHSNYIWLIIFLISGSLFHRWQGQTSRDLSPSWAEVEVTILCAVSLFTHLFWLNVHISL